MSELTDEEVRHVLAASPFIQNHASTELKGWLNEVKADAWDEGYMYGAHDEHEHRPGRKATNPYRSES